MTSSLWDNLSKVLVAMEPGEDARLEAIAARAGLSESDTYAALTKAEALGYVGFRPEGEATA